MGGLTNIYTLSSWLRTEYSLAFLPGFKSGYWMVDGRAFASLPRPHDVIYTYVSFHGTWIRTWEPRLNVKNK